MRAEQENRICIPDPPRPVPPHLYLRRARIMFFTGLFLMLFGPVMAVVLFAIMSAMGALVSPFVDLRLDSSHTVSAATVTAKKLITSVHSNSRHPWRIEFRFEPAGGGEVRTAGYTYDQELGNRLVAGDRIDIEYDPNDATRARPLGGYAGPTPPWVTLLVSGIFVVQGLLGAVLFAGALVAARRDAMLLAYGVAVAGSVLEVRCRKHMNCGTKHPYDVYYRFRDPWGRDVVGRDRTYSYAWAEGLRPGEQINVVFNPRDPRENALWLHGRELERLGGPGPALR